MDLRQYNDSELFHLLKLGKPEKDLAFKEIYNRYSKLIIAVISCIVKDEEAAGDIFQDTFTKFYNTSASHEGITNIAGYLTVIARNLSLNFVRDRKKQIEVEDGFLYNDESHNAENKELLELILNSVEMLEQPYRDAFVMREIDGMTYTQISSRLKISYENAKARSVRAKQKLIKILNPYLQDLSK